MPPRIILTMDTRPFESSPPKVTPRGFNQYSAGPVPLVKKRQDQLRGNMEGYYLGPMDPNQFMSTFMPINSQSLGTPPGGIDLSGVYNQTLERLIYSPFVRCSSGDDSPTNAHQVV